MKRLLLKNLRRIRDEGPVLDGHGICANMLWLGTALPGDLLSAWPDGLATPMYCPVEGSYTAYKQAQEAGTLWQDPRRWELLDWLIDTVEKELLDELAGEDA